MRRWTGRGRAFLAFHGALGRTCTTHTPFQAVCRQLGAVREGTAVASAELSKLCGAPPKAFAEGSADGTPVVQVSTWLFLLHVRKHEADIYCPLRGSVIATLDLETVRDEGEIPWETLQRIVAASRSEATAVFLLTDSTAASTAAGRLMETAMLESGFTAYCRTSVTDVVAALGQKPTTSSNSPGGAWATVLHAVARRSVVLTPGCRDKAPVQQIVDCVAPPFPQYIVHVTMQGNAGGMSFTALDLRTERRVTAAGHVEDVMALVLQLTASGPIVIIPTPRTTRDVLYIIMSAATRANRRIINVFPAQIRQSFLSAGVTGDVTKYLRELIAAGGAGYHAQDLKHDVTQAVGVAVRKTVAVASQPEALTTPAPPQLPEPVATWLAPIQSSERRSAEEEASVSLGRFLCVAYCASETTAFKRHANPTVHANHVTLFGLSDATGSEFLPQRWFASRGEAVLPDLAGYDTVVVHDAKRFLLLMWDDSSLQAFLKRGGMLWCTSVAEYVASAFQVRGASNTFEAVAARHGTPLSRGLFTASERFVSSSSMNRHTTRDLTEHDAMDVRAALRSLECIFESQRVQLVRNSAFIATKHRMVAVAAFAALEHNGLRIDEDKALRLASDIDNELVAVDQLLRLAVPSQIPVDAAREFNWHSPLHLDAFFFGGEVAIGARRKELVVSVGCAHTLVHIAAGGGWLGRMADNPLLRTFATALRLPPVDADSLLPAAVLGALDNGKRGKVPDGAAEQAGSTSGPVSVEALDYRIGTQPLRFRVVVFDLETTGLSPTHDRIVELSFFDPVTGETFSSLVNPGRSIPLETTRIHGIDNDMVSEAPRFRSVVKPLSQYLRIPTDASSPERLILVAHSAASMDEPMLRAHFEAAGSPLDPSLVLFCDTLPLLRSLKHKFRAPAGNNELESLRLGDLKKAFHIEDDGDMHRAETDVRVLWDVLVRCFRVEKRGADVQLTALMRAIARSVAVDGARHCLAGRSQTRQGSYPTLPGVVYERLGAQAGSKLARQLRGKAMTPNVIEELAAAGLKEAVLLAKRNTIERTVTTFTDLRNPRAPPCKERNPLLFLHPDGCVRQETKLVQASTGRTASAFPNCQSIPRDDKSEVRQLFISRYGAAGVCVEMDYAQLEVMVMALLSQDAAMLRDLANGVDFHVKRCAAFIPGVGYDELKARHLAGDPEVCRFRQKAKIMSFQRMYGAGAALLVRSSGLTRDAVDAMIAHEEHAYPGVKAFYALIRALCSRENNPGLPSHYIAEMPNGSRVSFTARDALHGLPPLKNYPIQAYGAELVQMAFGQAHQHLLRCDHYGGRVVMTNFVHDSVWFDCHEDVLPQLVPDMQRILSSVRALLRESYPGTLANVDFRTTCSVGRNMLDMQSYEAFTSGK